MPRWKAWLMRSSGLIKIVRASTLRERVLIKLENVP